MACRGSAAVRQPLPVVSAIFRRVMRPLTATALLRAGRGIARGRPARRRSEVVLVKLRLRPGLLVKLRLWPRLLMKLRLRPRILVKLRLRARLVVKLGLGPLHRPTAVRLEVVTLRSGVEVMTLVATLVIALGPVLETLLFRPARAWVAVAATRHLMSTVLLATRP